MRIWGTAAARSMAGAGVLIGLALGCLPRGTFPCSSDASCIRGGAAGTCEEGFCAYPDPACASGLSWDDLAGDGLAGVCVGDQGTDVTTVMGTESTTSVATTGGTDPVTGTETEGETETGGDCEMPGCTDYDNDGHCAEPDTEEPDCDDHNPARFEGCYYISPTGDDGATGTSPAEAWATFEVAVLQLQPSDSLVLLDGEYDLTNSGVLDVTCGLGAASIGTAASPISITAQNERAARIVSDGTVPAARLDGCAFWRLSRIHMMSTDAVHDAAAMADGAFVVRVLNSDHNLLRRLLVTNPNRYINSTLLRFDAVVDGLLEESEFYDYHHNAVDVQGATAVTLRRLYANSRGYPDLEGCEVTPVDPSVPRCSANPMAGGTAFNVNGTGVIIENCVSRSNATYGFALAGIDGRMLGSLSSQDGRGVYVTSWDGGTIEDVVVTRPVIDGVLLNATGGVARATLRNITVVDSEGSAFRNASGASGCADLPCQTTAVNLAGIGSLGAGVSTSGPGADLWTVRRSTLGGNNPDVLPAEVIDDNAGVVRACSTEEPADVGTLDGQCIVYIPDGSILEGAGQGGENIGATVLYRLRDGVETNAPLWDPVSSQFPCGVVVAGVNDDAFESCIGLHNWFNAGVAGCSLPTASEDPCL